MSPESADPVVDVLTRSQRGGVAYSEIAGILSTLECMHLMVSQADTMRMLEDMDDQLRKSGYGKVTMTPSTGPRVLGATTDDGRFLPRVFTRGDLLHEYAVSSGTIAPDATYMSVTRPWASGLFQFLAEGCGGIIFDEGTEHQAMFDRTGLMHLVAQITLAGFATQEKLFAVAVRNSVYFQEGEEGQGAKGLWAFVYDGEEAAERGIALLRQKQPDFAAVPVGLTQHLRGLLGRETTRLFVNPMLPDERGYTRADLARILELAESTGAPAAPAARSRPAPPVDPALDPALDPDAGAAPRATEPSGKPAPLWDAERSGPPRAMVPRPGRDGAAARAKLLEVKRLGDTGVKPWILSEALGFELDLHVPVFMQAVEGRTWPMLYTDHDKRTGEEAKTTHFFSTREAAEKELAQLPAEQRRHHALSGVEALRWAWACPVPIVQVFVDHPDPGGFIAFPTHWALPILFPTFLGVRDLKLVPEVPLGRLGQLPRIEGLEPRVLSALVNGWEKLLGPPSDDTTSYEPVAHAGGRYLPIYSDAEQFFSWSRKGAEGAATPEGAGDAPSWRSWLARARSCDGLVLDPGSPEPLTLDHTDVFFLDLWSRLGAQPDGSRVFAALGELLRDGVVDPVLAGRIAADWPAFFVGKTEVNGGPALVMVPGTDDLAVFTDEHRFDSFVTTYTMAGMLKTATQRVQILSRWQASVFRAAHEMFSGLWIDPEPLSAAGGIRLDPAGLDAALARLEHRLRPRVPGFEA